MVDMPKCQTKTCGAFVKVRHFSDESATPVVGSLTCLQIQQEGHFIADSEPPTCDCSFKSYWQIVLAIVLTERNAECDEEILDAISDGETPGEIRQPELVTDWRGSSDLPRVEFVFDFVREHVNILNK